MSVNTNLNATVAMHALTRNERAMNQAMERLSTGLRINSAADDAAGLAISSKMSSQINGLTQAVRNAQDATSMLSTADGALVAVTDMIQRMRELSIQAISDTNTDSDRAALDLEYQALKDEIDRIARNTQWNGRTFFDGTGFPEGATFQVGSEADQTISVDIGTIATNQLGRLPNADLYLPHANTPPTIDISVDTFTQHGSSAPTDEPGKNYSVHASTAPAASPSNTHFINHATSPPMTTVGIGYATHSSTVPTTSASSTTFDVKTTVSGPSAAPLLTGTISNHTVSNNIGDVIYRDHLSSEPSLTNVTTTTPVTALDGGSALVTNNIQTNGTFIPHPSASSPNLTLNQGVMSSTVGGLTRINSTTIGDQTNPDVAVLSDGGSVVVWESMNQDGSDKGIFGQRYDVTGSPVGSEFQINTYVSGSQQDPRISALADGGFAVSWNSASQYNGSNAIYSQRYDASGLTIGGEVRTDSGSQIAAVAGGSIVPRDSNTAILADGSYITFSSVGYSREYDNFNYSTAYKIVGTHCDALGNVLGTEEIETGSHYQHRPSVTVLAAGGYALAYEHHGFRQSYYQGGGVSHVDGSGSAMKVRVYDSSGNLTHGTNQQASIQVNTTTSSNQVMSSVTALDDGGFIVTWSNDSSATGLGGLRFGQRFDSLGNKVGDEFSIPEFSHNSAIEADSDGNLISVQSKSHREGSSGAGYGIFGKVTPVSTPPTSSVPASGSLDFAHLGLSSGDRLTINIPGGTDITLLVGSESLNDLVSEIATLMTAQSSLFTAASSEGSVLTFSGLNDGSTLPSITTTFEKPSAQAEIDFGGATFSAGDQVIVTVDGTATQYTVLSPGVTSAAVANGLASQLLSDTSNFSNVNTNQGKLIFTGLSDGSSLPTISVEFKDAYHFTEIDFNQYNLLAGDKFKLSLGGNSGATFEATIGTQGINATIGSMIPALNEWAGINDSVVSDGVLTIISPTVNTEGLDAAIEIERQVYGAHPESAPTPAVTQSVITTVAAGSEFKVNTYTSGNQGDPAITNLSNGGFVVTWTNESSQDGDGYGVFGQMYNASGNTVGAEFQVNTHTNSNQRHPDIAGLSDGGFVVTWHSRHQDGDDQGIFGQRFDASGNKSGAEFQVNTHTTSFQQYSAVTSLTDGGFVVTWHDDSGHDGSADGVFGQRYSSSGSATGSQFQINSTTASAQAYPSISSLSGGGFVATWTDYSGEDGSGKGIFGQRYDASGNKVASEFQINTHTSGDQSWSDIASLPNGGFVVTWNSSGQDANGEGVYAQRYNASGERDGAEFRVNTYQTGNEMHSEVTALNDGGYVVIWYSDTHTGDTNYGIHGQRFDASGAAVGSQFLVNTDTSNAQQYPEIAPLADGGFVIAWQSSAQDGSGYGIYAQRFSSAITPATTTIDFSGRSLVVGDKVVLEIAGGTSVKGVIGANGLDGLLTSLSASLAAQDSIFSAVSSSSGVLTLTGLASGAALPAVTVSLEQNSTTNQNLINFNGKNLVLGDRITLGIDGGTQVQGVLGSQGLDALLANMATELSSQSSLFGSVSSQNGILYMNGPDANTDPPRVTVNLEDAFHFSSLDFNGKNLVEGDRITLNISGGQKVEGVIGAGGLDATLASMAADAGALSNTYSSVSANSGVLTLVGLLDAISMPGVTVTIEAGTEREAQIDFSDRNLMEGDRINLTVSGGDPIQAVVSPNGLDATLSAIASELAAQNGLFVSASASSGVISYKGLETGPPVADITVTLESLNNSQALFPTAINSFDNAVTAMERIDTSVTQINERRASFGAVINRLDFAADNLSNIVLNTEASRSRIEDADYAAETTALARTQIIQQAATAMLAQANMQTRQVLELLELDG